MDGGGTDVFATCGIIDGVVHSEGVRFGFNGSGGIRGV